MRCGGVTVILLLALLCIQDTTAKSRSEILGICLRQYPARKCGAPEWYRMSGNRCIKLFWKTREPYIDARRICRKEGGDLVSMHNVEEYSQVLCLVARSFKNLLRVWVGGQRGTNYHFKWSDGTPWKFTRWAPRQPDFFFLHEFCVEMNYGDWGRWNDNYCMDRKAFVCARKG
ncbi:C-type isolectin Sp-CL4-like [Centroberyx affinis]|uniref:C-type isolectin Sp-CL4-like n=1 Tax=Centroberyx affinis TaxID=166261 RepID=UPI003A5C464E